MFLPKPILQKLSPIACKTYLALLSQLSRKQSLPIVTFPMKDLAPFLSLSPRACTRALTELQTHKIIRRLPIRYHKSRAFEFLPPEGARPALPPVTNRPLQSGQPASNRPPQSAHARPVPATRNHTPLIAPKTPNRPPMSALLNQLLARHNQPPVSGQAPAPNPFQFLPNH